MTVVVEVESLVKRFRVGRSAGWHTWFRSSVESGGDTKNREGDMLTAVDGVSFSISEGTCFGLLGPNGAGKTTTVEMLEGIVAPDSGTITYRGGPLDASFKQRCGIMFQNTALQDYLTVREALQMFARFYRHTLPIDDLISTCSLSDFIERDTRKLSGGQRQRLLLAIALVNDPDVIFLDEPTTGLDPQARRNFWELVNRIKGLGKTVILTTHYMEEARQLCDELVFMDHGKIIAQGAPDDLLANNFDSVVLRLPITNDANSSALLRLLPETESTQPPSLQTRSAHDLESTEPAGQNIVVSEKMLEITTRDVDASIAWLQSHDVSLAELEIRSRSLEDLFIELTGGGLRA